MINESIKDVESGIGISISENLGDFRITPTREPKPEFFYITSSTDLQPESWDRCTDLGSPSFPNQSLLVTINISFSALATPFPSCVWFQRGPLLSRRDSDISLLVQNLATYITLSLSPVKIIASPDIDTLSHWL